MIPDFHRVFDIIEYRRSIYDDNKSLNIFSQNNWQGLGIKEIQQKVNMVSCWLIDNNFKKEDKIILVSNNGNPDWMIIDFACQQIGLIIIPVHPSSSVKELVFIINETKAIACISATAELYHKYQNLCDHSTTLKHCYHLQENTSDYFSALHKKKVNNELLITLEQFKAKISPDEVFCILYTSGTSGTPKGVMLTHQNVVSNIKSLLKIIPLKKGNRVLSFLPFSHILERTACYGYMAAGVEIYFGENKESFANDFKTVKPIFCICVPRILEKMYDYMQEQKIGKSWLKKLIISWAINIGKSNKAEQSNSLFFSIQLILARLLVLNKWKNSLGGKLKYIAVGSAALRPDISKLISSSGIMVREGYGMTETSPFITINGYKKNQYKFGTVGLPIENVQIKIDPTMKNNGEGEILVKGPNVMKGYFQRPILTQNTFTDDGWLKTGDIGKLIEGKFLKITGRKKEIFKTSSGKYIAPEPLQIYINSSSFIEQNLIIGFKRPYITALIVPNFTILQKWCEINNIHWTSPQFMVHNIKVIALIKNEINSLNESIANYRRIRNFYLCHYLWTIENGCLTSSYKIKRNKLLDHFKKEIDRTYEKGNYT